MVFLHRNVWFSKSVGFSTSVPSLQMACSATKEQRAAPLPYIPISYHFTVMELPVSMLIHLPILNLYISAIFSLSSEGYDEQLQ